MKLLTLIIKYLLTGYRYRYSSYASREIVFNTNPLSEIGVNFFGFEDDAVTSTDFPPIPDISGPYDDVARQFLSTIQWFLNMGGNEYLGNVNLIFTKKFDNYGFVPGFGGKGMTWRAAASDDIYSNIYYKSEALEGVCGTDGIGFDCSNKDWPDFTDYIINFRIIDRDGQRCPSDSAMYDYNTGECKDVILG